MRSSSYPTTMHAASHTSSHPATMAATAATTMAATATTTPAGERRWRQSKRRTERNRDQATKSLVVHPDYSVLNRSDGHRRKKTVRRAKLSNDFN
jgi:hypothetical protein